MKKTVLLILTLILALLVFAAPAVAADEIAVYVDGSKLSFDVQPIIIQGVTFVPMRAIFEGIGATVTWDQATRTAFGVKGENTVSVQIGSMTGYKNGQAIPLLQAARLTNSRTLVPLRFISESLDCAVEWDGAARTITIASLFGPYEVVKIVDGDTITLSIDGADEKVRMIGVDTPESVHPDADKNSDYGWLASEYTKTALSGKRVFLEYDVETRDKYGRLLAYVWVDGSMFNKTLLSAGMAVTSTYPPNIKHVDEFTALQAAAREAKVGLWSGSAFDGYIDEGAPATNFTGKYYATKSGAKYHYLNPCGSGTYYEISPEEIQRRGLEPCQKCAH